MEMSICMALWMILSRSIHALDIKKNKTKQQQKRAQQRLSEQSHGSARFQPYIRSSQEYQHLGGHEHPGEEALRDSDHNHDGRNNSFAHRTVVPSFLRTFGWLDAEVVGPLEDKLPMYDHNAAQLTPYDMEVFRRRQREGSHGDDRNGAQINEPRGGGACTRMRIMGHPYVNQGEAMIWYDALEDRYEVISRSLAPPTEPLPLLLPYMPNRRVESRFT